MRGPDKTPAAPARDWRTASVDLVIPARNEQDNIVRCLASVLRQTLRPRKIVVVDDGSTDATSARAQAFAKLHDADVLVIQRLDSIGKTPSIKDQARSLDSDVLGGNATVEATFGIYRRWALKVNGGGMFNQRLGSGAFRGYGAGVSLIRRF